MPHSGRKDHYAEEGFTVTSSIQMVILQLAQNSGQLLADRCIFMVVYAHLIKKLSFSLRNHLLDTLLGVARIGVWVTASPYLFTTTLLAS